MYRTPEKRKQPLYAWGDNDAGSDIPSPSDLPEEFEFADSPAATPQSFSRNPALRLERTSMSTTPDRWMRHSPVKVSTTRSGQDCKHVGDEVTFETSPQRKGAVDGKTSSSSHASEAAKQRFSIQRRSARRRASNVNAAANVQPDVRERVTNDSDTQLLDTSMPDFAWQSFEMEATGSFIGSPSAAADQTKSSSRTPMSMVRDSSLHGQSGRTILSPLQQRTVSHDQKPSNRRASDLQASQKLFKRASRLSVDTSMDQADKTMPQHMEHNQRLPSPTPTRRPFNALSPMDAQKIGKLKAGSGLGGRTAYPSKNQDQVSQTHIPLALRLVAGRHLRKWHQHEAIHSLLAWRRHCVVKAFARRQTAEALRLWGRLFGGRMIRVWRASTVMSTRQMTRAASQTRAIALRSCMKASFDFMAHRACQRRAFCQLFAKLNSKLLRQALRSMKNSSKSSENLKKGIVQMLYSVLPKGRLRRCFGTWRRLLVQAQAAGLEAELFSDRIDDMLLGKVLKLWKHTASKLAAGNSIREKVVKRWLLSSGNAAFRKWVLVTDDMQARRGSALRMHRVKTGKITLSVWKQTAAELAVIRRGLECVMESIDGRVLLKAWSQWKALREDTYRRRSKLEIIHCRTLMSTTISCWSQFVTLSQAANNLLGVVKQTSISCVFKEWREQVGLRHRQMQLAQQLNGHLSLQRSFIGMRNVWKRRCRGRHEFLQVWLRATTHWRMSRGLLAFIGACKRLRADQWVKSSMLDALGHAMFAWNKAMGKEASSQRQLNKSLSKSMAASEWAAASAAFRHNQEQPHFEDQSPRVRNANQFHNSLRLSARQSQMLNTVVLRWKHTMLCSALSAWCEHVAVAQARKLRQEAARAFLEDTHTVNLISRFFHCLLKFKKRSQARLSLKAARCDKMSNRRLMRSTWRALASTAPYIRRTKFFSLTLSMVCRKSILHSVFDEWHIVQRFGRQARQISAKGAEAAAKKFEALGVATLGLHLVAWGKLVRTAKFAALSFRRKQRFSASRILRAWSSATLRMVDLRVLEAIGTARCRDHIIRRHFNEWHDVLYERVHHARLREADLWAGRRLIRKTLSYWERQRVTVRVGWENPSTDVIGDYSNHAPEPACGAKDFVAAIDNASTSTAALNLYIERDSGMAVKPLKIPKMLHNVQEDDVHIRRPTAPSGSTSQTGHSSARRRLRASWLKNSKSDALANSAQKQNTSLSPGRTQVDGSPRNSPVSAASSAPLSPPPSSRRSSNSASNLSTASASSQLMFYVQPVPGWEIVAGCLVQRNMRRCKFESGLRQRSDWDYAFTFKPNEIDFDMVPGGPGRIVSQIEGMQYLTTKSGMLATLRLEESLSAASNAAVDQTLSLGMPDWANASRQHTHTSTKISPTWPFMPQSCNVYEFYHAAVEAESGPWIVKPPASSGGRGIQIFQSAGDLIAKYAQDKQANSQHALKGKRNVKAEHRVPDAPAAYEAVDVLTDEMIVSKYVDNPLLLKGHKFEIRMYVTIARTYPALVFIRPALAYTCLEKYTPDVDMRLAHLTSPRLQRMHPKFLAKKDHVAIPLSKISQLIDSITGNSAHTLRSDIMPKIRAAIAFSVRRALPKLSSRSGCFSLVGCDVLLDTNLNPWILEFDRIVEIEPLNTCMRQVVTDTVQECIDLSFAVHKTGVDYMPQLQGFEVLIDDERDQDTTG